MAAVNSRNADHSISRSDVGDGAPEPGRRKTRCVHVDNVVAKRGMFFSRTFVLVGYYDRESRDAITKAIEGSSGLVVPVEKFNSSTPRTNINVIICRDASKRNANSFSKVLQLLPYQQRKSVLTCEYLAKCFKSKKQCALSIDNYQHPIFSHLAHFSKKSVHPARNGLQRTLAEYPVIKHLTVHGYNQLPSNSTASNNSYACRTNTKGFANTSRELDGTVNGNRESPRRTTTSPQMSPPLVSPQVDSLPRDGMSNPPFASTPNSQEVHRARDQVPPTTPAAQSPGRCDQNSQNSLSDFSAGDLEQEMLSEEEAQRGADVFDQSPARIEDQIEPGTLDADDLAQEYRSDAQPAPAAGESSRGQNTLVNAMMKDIGQDIYSLQQKFESLKRVLP